MKDSTILGVVTIICGTIGFLYALYKGYDHAIVATFFTTIGTITGYAYGVHKK